MTTPTDTTTTVSLPLTGIEISTARLAGIPEVTAILFEADLQLEYSAIPQATPLGRFKNRMELVLHERKHPVHGTGMMAKSGCIVWNYGKAAADEDETVIGLSFDGLVVTDYDGVFELPKEAVALLQLRGYDTSVVVSED